MDFGIRFGDRVEAFESRNGVRRSWSDTEFAEFISRMHAKFPDLHFECGTRYDMREVKGNDFFLVMKYDGRERAFIVRRD